MPSMLAERLARWSLRLVVTAGVLAVIGGLASAALWRPSRGSPAADTCAEPPCFGGDGLPGLEDLPIVAPVALLGMAALLGGVALLLAVITAVKGGSRRLLALGAVAAVGPLVVLVGGEVLPHLLSPCAPAELWGAQAPSVCVGSSDGLDLPDRWHSLDHAVVGFLPLSLALAWWARRLRRPQVGVSAQPTGEV